MSQRPANLLRTIASQLDVAHESEAATSETTEPDLESSDRPRGGALRGRAEQGYAARNRPHTIVLPNTLIDRLDEAVRSTGRSKADLTRTALERYLDELSL